MANKCYCGGVDNPDSSNNKENKRVSSVIKKNFPQQQNVNSKIRQKVRVAFELIERFCRSLISQIARLMYRQQ